MLRAVTRVTSRRSFVSSVLLTRTWENDSVAELRKELKSRGLPVSGNKAHLILRIQEHDNARTLNALRDPPVARPLSTPAAPAGVAPGIPPAPPPRPAPQDFFTVALPDLWLPIPETPVQI
ncbi:hypothetical protein H0H87_002457, partial [Tephrocybe sp. NHM501043]